VTETPALRLENVVTERGRIRVLWGLDIEVRTGETVAIVGPNGAGKTTLLATIMGLLRPSGGRILVGERDTTGASPEAMARTGLALVPERRQLFGALTVRENLLLGGYARRTQRREFPADVEECLELFPALRRYLDSPSGGLSGGEQQMVAIARALMARPKILLLDEPSLGLAPRVRAENFAALARLAERGATILLVEQNLRMAARICTRAYFMESGRIVGSGSPEDLVRNERAFFTGTRG
jgi:branched-chain amino acid transport system ATP-binding protein